MLMIKRLMTRYVPGMLTCEEVDGFLYDFHEGQLSRTEQFKFKLHLKLCKECKDYVLQYKNTIQMAHTEFTKADSVESVPEALIEAILKSRTKK